ncbi:leucine-rich repeat domain-containing protein [Pseudoteredinibacter isoporae]|uniref:IPTL-CTERM protein sorting domain-containing protein n=1 Tax=Pseudoteredinibacter isoporae TaxID=570281 RepID=A0A7X0JU02_9GAMM|nr:leucine-rich repeat domain-containing protein [Pseudoteredinibacter isoporae]MBB6521301.1 hypothetical protein [Pseudoteredinibacter isoporae]NHO86858.1 leucine-rich repeat domain-containing protein [Pseudoteredinibacter isoporae]NIB24690.1 leucine-rich repeat domain-containing protein [Pseudoteredinibacter isoporae]
MLYRLIPCGLFFFLFATFESSAQTLVYNGAGDTVIDCTGCGGALTIPADNAGTPVTTIGSNSLRGDGITSVVFPNTLITIGGESFANNNLTSVTIPASVTTIGSEAFEHNAISTALFEGDRPTIGGSAFSGSPPITTINYCAGASGWPGADIEGVTPTAITCSSASAATPSAVPASTSFTMMVLAGLLTVFASRAKRKKPNLTVR